MGSHNNKKSEGHHEEWLRAKVELLQDGNEAYRQSAEVLKWAVGIILTLLVVFVGYVAFRDRKEYDQASEAAQEAAREALKYRDQAEGKAESITALIDRLRQDLQQQGAQLETQYQEARGRFESEVDEAKKHWQAVEESAGDTIAEIEAEGRKAVLAVADEGRGRLELDQRWWEEERITRELWSKAASANLTGDHATAARYWKYVCEREPNNTSALRNRGIALAAIAAKKSGKESERYSLSALDEFQRALQIDPNDEETLSSWAFALSDCARKASGEEAAALYTSAIEKFEAAARVSAPSADVLCAWACSIVMSAGSSSQARTRELLQRAYDLTSRASRLESENSVAFCMLGILRTSNALLESGDDARRLFAESRAAFEQASRIGEPTWFVPFTWALALVDEAGAKTGVEAERIEQKAHDKFSQAFALDPDQISVWYNWAFLELRRALRRMREGDAANAIFFAGRACTKAAIAVRQEPSAEHWVTWGDALAIQAAATAEVYGKEEIPSVRILFDQACEKYEMGIAVNPRSTQAFGNWGLTLVAWASYEKDQFRDSLLSQARQMSLSPPRTQGQRPPPPC